MRDMNPPDYLADLPMPVTKISDNYEEMEKTNFESKYQ